jgi:quercetin dioxygenase-like cupin family protein/alkylhydroperoxidase/carboxymuconolactone decarboxylase family protein YurZ
MVGAAKGETMKDARVCILIASTVLLLGFPNTGNAQDRASDTPSLSANQQSIVLISSHTARGDLERLTHALNVGLDSGLTINEIKEVMLQLYAYCGFPRSLSGINTFMAVLEDRETRGIHDEVGALATPQVSNENKYEQGKQVLGVLTGWSQNRPRSGYSAFFPTIELFLKEHLFADIFGRGVLSYQDREITTVAALVSMGGVEPYARAHMGLALNVGVTESQLRQLLALIESNVGEAEARSGQDLLSQVLAWQMDTEAGGMGGEQSVNREARLGSSSGSQIGSTVFPRGRRITSDNFTGSVWVEMLVTEQEVYGSRIGNVTFEPGARTNWHSHPGGQILLVTNGAGYYQEQGGPIRLLRKGDVVEIRPGVVHWHGATPTGEFTHVAVVTNSLDGATAWLQPVTDEEYNRFW